MHILILTITVCKKTETTIHRCVVFLVPRYVQGHHSNDHPTHTSEAARLSANLTRPSLSAIYDFNDSSLDVKRAIARSLSSFSIGSTGLLKTELHKRLADYRFKASYAGNVHHIDSSKTLKVMELNETGWFKTSCTFGSSGMKSPKPSLAM